VANALNRAVKTVQEGGGDVRAAAEKKLPAAIQFLSRVAYTASYTVSYGVVFPAVLVAKSVPADNALVHGFADGARDASAKVDHVKHRQPKALAAPSRSPSTRGRRKPAR
jgi:hypothetical protein